MVNLLGYHFVDNVYTEAQIAQHMDLLRITQPAWINVLGGMQYEQALNFAVAVRKAFPMIRVIFRHYKDGGDDGMHTRLTASEWWEKIGSLYIGKDLTILSDNESMAGDLTTYANWQAAVMTLAGAKRVSIAYGRFATHNPPIAQFKQLDSMFRAAARFGNLHIYSPNVYFSKDNNDGHEYPFYAIQRCADIGIEPPQTIAIGEYAFAEQLRAHEGYKSVKMDGAAYINDLAKRHAKYFQGVGIAACIYAIGEWPMGNKPDGSKQDTFGLDEAAINALKARSVPVIIAPPQTPPIPDPPKPLPAKPDPVPKPEKVGAGYPTIITPPAPLLNMRDGPDEAYTKIGEIKTGETVTHFADYRRADPDNAKQFWYWVETPHGNGWVADVEGKVIFSKVVPPAPPAVPSDKDLALDAVRLAISQYSELIAKLTSEKALLELALQKAENGV